MPNNTDLHKKRDKFKDFRGAIPDMEKLCTFDGNQYYTFNKNSWIGGTGTSCFIRYNDTNIYDVKKNSKGISVISWNVAATKLGKQ